MRRIRWLALMAGGVVVSLGTFAESLISIAESAPPKVLPHPGRSAVIAKNGIVATSHPLAAQAGLDILKAGGNAADAAIAANAMIGLVEPMSCGIGGDLFAIYWDAKTNKLYGLNASGRSPYKLNRDIFAQKNLKEIPETGPLSWSVPGCVDGWEMLRSKFGTLNYDKLLASSIQTAEEGFPVSQIIAGHWSGSANSLSKWPDSARTYLPHGRAPKVGELFKNPNLAASYRAIATGGRDAFYEGAIAAEIVRFSEANGGYFSMQDFKDHTSEWVQPVSTNYRGYDVWELPPNGQGIAALQMLNVLERYDLKSLGPFHPDYLHLLIEAKKLAFADRARFYFDPAFGTPPVSTLISKEYAARQAARIDMAHAAKQVSPGDVDARLSHGDTIYLTVVDKDRNCCSLIQSNYFGFGSQIVPGNVGFALQNRGCLFALDENHPNRLEPHKRPFHTIIPAFVTKDGKPYLAFGVMGGDFQPQGHVQVLINMLDFGMNVQQAGEHPRVQHTGSATPTGRPMAANGGTVGHEWGIPLEALQALESRGHQLAGPGGAFGGYQAILIDHVNGVLHGGTDPRKDGCAVGY
jgi:gamma-glutamyltranspeptidase/glutathione hydrolase